MGLLVSITIMVHGQLTMLAHISSKSGRAQTFSGDSATLKDGRATTAARLGAVDAKPTSWTTLLTGGAERPWSAPAASRMTIT